MALGLKRGYGLPPNFADSVQQDWATWVTNGLQDLQGPATTPLPPQVTTISHPGAVQIVWNEQNQSSAYAVYETETASDPPGVPISTVAANMAAIANSFMRFNINDTTTRYYSVVTIGQFTRSAPSTPVPGAALAVSDPVISVSNVPVDQNGVGGGLGGGGGLFGVNPGPPF